MSAFPSDPVRSGVRTLALSLGVLLSGIALAFETQVADIGFEDNTYSYVYEAIVDAPAAQVQAVVTDYARLYRINNNIVESRVLKDYGNGALKRILRIERCILGFCFKLRFVEHLRETQLNIVTTIIPEESSFRDGSAEWLLKAIDAQHTRVILSARQTPDFWIPPFIGPLVIRAVFLSEVEETCARIEQLAQAAGAKP